MSSRGTSGPRRGGSSGRRPSGPAGASGPPRRTRPPTPRRGVDDLARRAAYEVLRAVDERDAYANLVLPGLLRERGVTGRDAAFATELAYGTLRGLGTYDAVLAACVDRPLAGVDPPVRDVLRLGAHQLLGMRVPDHAAVGATVDLARAAVGEGPARFVNAVLRRVTARDLPAWLDLVAPPAETDPVGSLAVRAAHPRWIVDAFRDALGGDLEDTRRLLEADNLPPAVTLAVRPGRGSQAELLAQGAAAGRWSPYAAVLDKGDPGELPAVRQGRAGVQDEGSQLVALALAAAPLAAGGTGAGGHREGGAGGYDGAGVDAGPVRDRRWLDLCAGPGGKSALLGGLAGQRGALLLANELQPHRAQLLARAVAGTAAVVLADATAPAWRPASFDRVLVDSPCTGLGALRRRPEARWRRTPRDVAALAPLQRDLLRSALDAVRPGGVVAYVTCSPHLAETRVVVSDVLRRGAVRAERLDARPLLPGVPDLGDGPDVQLWPHRHGTDAMYLALLRRVGGGD